MLKLSDWATPGLNEILRTYLYHSGEKSYIVSNNVLFILLYTVKIFTLLKILCPFTGRFILLIQSKPDLILILTPQVRTVNLS